MDIYGFAIEIEKEGEAYYSKLAANAENKGLRSIFTWLAGEEAKHRKIIDALRKDMAPSVAATTILSDAKTVFEKMKEAQPPFHFDNIEVEMYKKARQLEKNSKDFYTEKANQAESAMCSVVFLKIAGEEDKHIVLLDTIINFVNRPHEYLENAEFVHLDEY